VRDAVTDINKAKLEIERVDFEDEITYQVSYTGKHFHVIFRELDHIDEKLSCKHEAEKYVNAVNNYEKLKRQNEILREHLENLLKKTNIYSEEYLNDYTNIDVRFSPQDLINARHVLKPCSQYDEQTNNGVKNAN
jgi:hypothetical protein